METKTKTKTHWRKLHNPNFLGSFSLEEGKDMILTINKVVKENVKTERGEEECSVAYFTEAVKPMILNVTNSKQIEKLYSTPYVEEWKGKKIQVYATKISAFGGEVDALRIRPVVPKTAKKELTPEHSRWNAAKKALEEGNTTLEAILTNYHISKANQIELQKAS